MTEKIPRILPIREVSIEEVNKSIEEINKTLEQIYLTKAGVSFPNYIQNLITQTVGASRTVYSDSEAPESRNIRNRVQPMAANKPIDSVVTHSFINGVEFTWETTLSDISYYKFRFQVEDEGWKDWQITTFPTAAYFLDSTEADTYTSVATIHIEIVAIKVNGTEYPLYSTSGLTQIPTMDDAYISSLSAAKLTAGTVMTPGVYIGGAKYTSGATADSLQPSEVGATEGASWVSNLSNIPSRFGDSAADAGLYVLSTFLGYYNGSSFTAYIGNDGDFYFAGDSDNYIAWDGSDFDISTEGKFYIKAGGGIEIQPGGDITLSGLAGNAGVLYLEGTTGLATASLTADSTTNVSFGPPSSGTKTLTFGPNDWSYIIFYDDYHQINCDVAFTVDAGNLEIDSDGDITCRYLYPHSTTSYNLGSSSLRWNTLFAAVVNATGSSTLGFTTFAGNAVPDSGEYLGESTAVWERVYSNNYYAGTTAGVSASLVLSGLTSITVNGGIITGYA